VQPGLQLSALILLLVPSREANSRPAFFSSVAVHALWQFVLPVRDSRRGALFGISSARQIHRRSSRLLHQSASSWSRFLFAAQDRFRFSSLICSSSPSLPSLHLHSVLSSCFVDSAREARQSELVLPPASSVLPCRSGQCRSCHRSSSRPFLPIFCRRSVRIQGVAVSRFPSSSGSARRLCSPFWLPPTRVLSSVDASVIVRRFSVAISSFDLSLVSSFP
jgi:hypothetical protein